MIAEFPAPVTAETAPRDMYRYLQDTKGRWGRPVHFTGDDADYVEVVRLLLDAGANKEAEAYTPGYHVNMDKIHVQDLL